MTVCEYGGCDRPAQPFVYRDDLLNLCEPHAAEYAEFMDDTFGARLDDLAIALRRVGREIIKSLNDGKHP